jgi:CcmD family protein
MIASIFQQAPAQTTNYMVAGYAVIFSVIFIYIISLVLRTRNLKRDRQTLNELAKKEK